MLNFAIIFYFKKKIKMIAGNNLIRIIYNKINMKTFTEYEAEWAQFLKSIDKKSWFSDTESEEEEEKFIEIKKKIRKKRNKVDSIDRNMRKKGLGRFANVNDKFGAIVK